MEKTPKEIIRENFPEIISKRMETQTGWLPQSDTKGNLILGFASWLNTKEPFDFWSDLQLLYSQNENPPMDEIISIFNKYNIEQ